MNANENQYCELAVTNSSPALVDPEDYIKCYVHTWCLARGGYAKTGFGYLSHFVLGVTPPPGFVVDHINRNPLDNRKVNLRVISYSGNLINRTLKSGENRSIYIDKKSGSIYVQITRNKKVYRVGIFPTYEAARKGRDEFLLKTFGQKQYDFSCV